MKDLTKKLRVTWRNSGSRSALRRRGDFNFEKFLSMRNFHSPYERARPYTGEWYWQTKARSKKIYVLIFFKKSSLHIHISRKYSFTFSSLVLKGHNVNKGLSRRLRPQNLEFYISFILLYSFCSMFLQVKFFSLKLSVIEIVCINMSSLQK